MMFLKRIRDKITSSGVLKSATIGVAGTITTVGVAMQASPEVEALVKAFVPDNYEGMVIAALGLVVAVARFRTLGK